jgi:hypothetical protein
VKRRPIDDEFDHCYDLARELGGDGLATFLSLNPADVDQMTPADIEEAATHMAIRIAAREWLRTGKDVAPPIWLEKRMADTVSLTVRRNLLTEWKLRVERDAGEFVEWCHQAGMPFGSSKVWPEKLEYYEHDDTESSRRWRRIDPTFWAQFDDPAEAENHAVMGHFYCFMLRPSELAEYRVDALVGVVD